jgi:hypothetical protein
MYMRRFGSPSSIGYQFVKVADEGIHDIGKHVFGVFRFGCFSGNSSNAFIYHRFDNEGL